MYLMATQTSSHLFLICRNTVSVDSRTSDRVCFGSASVSGIRYNSDQPQPWSENLPDGSNAEGIKIPGFGRLYFPADSDRVQMTLANPSDNHCYFVYTINLNESDGELLYTSCNIEPGMALSEITLSRSLAAGEYVLYIHVTPYDSDSGKRLNNALLKAPLVVTAE